MKTKRCWARLDILYMLFNPRERVSCALSKRAIENFKSSMPNSFWQSCILDNERIKMKFLSGCQGCLVFCSSWQRSAASDHHTAMNCGQLQRPFNYSVGRVPCVLMAGKCETGYRSGTGRNCNYSRLKNVSIKAGRAKEFQLDTCQHYHLIQSTPLE